MGVCGGARHLLLVLVLALSVAWCDAAGERTFRLAGLFSHDSIDLRDEAPNWAANAASLPVEQRCPNGTGYVVRPSDPTGRDLVLGCCPLGQIGCVPPGNDRVVGCCPRFSHCLYRHAPSEGGNHDAFLGCTDTVARDCYGKRCPRDYGCCRRANGESVCAPHERGDDDDAQVENALDYSAYCGAEELLWPLMSVFSLRRAQFRYFPRPPRLANLTSLAVPGLSENVTGSLTASPPQYSCSSTNQRCHISDACDERNVTFVTANGTDVTQTQRTYCCPAAGNYSLCTVPDQAALAATNTSDTPEFVGCADLDAGEQCCGRSICPAQSKCCESVSNAGLVVDRFCCPTQLECCYGDPARAATGSEAILNENTISPRSYCGVRIGNSTCRFDRQMPLNWLYLHLAAARHGNT